jgi:hypothetical protein
MLKKSTVLSEDSQFWSGNSWIQVQSIAAKPSCSVLSHDNGDHNDSMIQAYANNYARVCIQRVSGSIQTAAINKPA